MMTATTTTTAITTTIAMTTTTATTAITRVTARVMVSIILSVLAKDLASLELTSTTDGVVIAKSEVLGEHEYRCCGVLSWIILHLTAPR
jgi:hypothetical protein